MVSRKFDRPRKWGPKKSSLLGSLLYITRTFPYPHRGQKTETYIIGEKKKVFTYVYTEL